MTAMMAVILKDRRRRGGDGGNGLVKGMGKMALAIEMIPVIKNKT